MGLVIIAIVLYYREAADLGKNKLLWIAYGALSFLIPYYSINLFFSSLIAMIAAGIISYFILDKISKNNHKSDIDILDS